MLLSNKDYKRILAIKEEFHLTYLEIAEMIGYTNARGNACNISKWLKKKQIPPPWEVAFRDKILALTNADKVSIAEKKYRAKIAKKG